MGCPPGLEADWLAGPVANLVATDSRLVEGYSFVAQGMMGCLPGSENNLPAVPQPTDSSLVEDSSGSIAVLGVEPRMSDVRLAGLVALGSKLAQVDSTVVHCRGDCLVRLKRNWDAEVEHVGHGTAGMLLVVVVVGRATVLGEDHCTVSSAGVEHILVDMVLHKAALARQSSACEARKGLGRNPVAASKRHREVALSDSFVVLSYEECLRYIGSERC